MAVLRDLMNPSVVTVEPDASVAQSAALMVSARVGSAIVLQDSFLAGILTERDVLRAAASGGDLTASPVRDWMTPQPESAGPEATADEAAEVMLRGGFRHLPILDGRRVCGVVSLRDLFAARIRRPAR
jgi:CBS domain-containing protein